jgi:tetratricopeptide (TPR) repeat protein
MRWQNKGSVLADLGRYDEAVQCFEKILSVEPNNAQAWRLKGMAFERLGLRKDARKCFDRVSKLSDAMASQGRDAF